MPHPVTAQEGQASVELLALVPLVVLVAAVLWQGVLAGQVAWSSGSAARAAARASALGRDASEAARRALPGSLRAHAHVRERDGGVEVRLGVPSVLGGGRALATITTRAAFPAQ